MAALQTTTADDKETLKKSRPTLAYNRFQSVQQAQQNCFLEKKGSLEAKRQNEPEIIR